MILIATKELVSETSHDLILNLYLGIAPRARSWSQNMLRDISFVDHSPSLIISKQRVCSHVLPYTYLGSTTLLSVVCLLSRMLRTLWIQNPAFIEQCILQRLIFFCTRPSIGLTCGIGTSKNFEDRKFCILRSFFFKPPCKRPGFYKFCQDLRSRDLCWVPHSGSTPRWVPPSSLPKDSRTLSARKGSWAVGHLSRTSHQRIS